MLFRPPYLFDDLNPAIQGILLRADLLVPRFANTESFLNSHQNNQQAIGRSSPTIRRWF